MPNGDNGLPTRGTSRPRASDGPGSGYEDRIGTIIGLQGGCIIVEMVNGERVSCRGIRRLHQHLGFFDVPAGRRAIIRFRKSQKKQPLLVDVLHE